ncbi:MAG: BACON domain-containing protein [Alistipes sp.]|nr:BACON domain-containing protein [Alistipes sp.]
MKYIVSAGTAMLCLAGAMCLSSCEIDDAEYPKVIELVSPQNVYEIDENGGTLEIQVYANDGYSIKFANKIEDEWASLDKRHMKGDGTIVLDCKANEGFRRMAVIALRLDSGAKADTVYIKQKGIVPAVECEAPFRAIEGSSQQPAEFGIDTNIPFEDFEISYSNGGEEWLSQPVYNDGVLRVTPQYNNSANPRSSIISMRYVDSWEEEFLLRIFITQADKDDNFGRTLTFSEARAMATEAGAEITDDVNIEGWIISDYRSKNMELNPSVNYDKVDTSVSDRTAYIESADGSCGIRLQFDEASDNVLSRYSFVQISLKDAVMVRESDPDRYTVTGLTAENILSGRAGEASELPVKRKTIAELTDDDIYTFVTLTDTEFLFKDGCYANVYENYTLSSSVNASLSGNNNRLDGWASLLFDRNGDGIYMLMNMLCTWRRSGLGVPQGAGDINGIIVHSEVHRYGDYIGRYQIRPVDEKDILTMGNGASNYTTLAEYNGHTYAYKFGQYVAKVDAKYKANGLESICPPDYDKFPKNTELYCENHAMPVTASLRNYPITGCYDYNARDLGDRGIPFSLAYPDSKNTAYGIRANVKGWYEWTDGKITGINGIRLEFSTSEVTGTHMCLGFTFSAGTVSANTSKTFPAHWCVEYSTDGGATYNEVKDRVVCDSHRNQPYFKLRSLPWWDASVNGNKYYTCYDAGLGMTDHMFVFPADIFGKEKVMIRIRPYDNVLSSLPIRWDDNSETGEIKMSTSYDNYIQFGTITLRYM